jgi:hypothetical protein
VLSWEGSRMIFWLLLVLLPLVAGGNAAAAILLVSEARLLGAAKKSSGWGGKADSANRSPKKGAAWSSRTPTPGEKTAAHPASKAPLPECKHPKAGCAQQAYRSPHMAARCGSCMRVCVARAACAKIGTQILLWCAVHVRRINYVCRARVVATLISRLRLLGSRLVTLFLRRPEPASLSDCKGLCSCCLGCCGLCSCCLCCCWLCSCSSWLRRCLCCCWLCSCSSSLPWCLCSCWLALQGWRRLLVFLVVCRVGCLVVFLVVCLVGFLEVCRVACLFWLADLPVTSSSAVGGEGLLEEGVAVLASLLLLAAPRRSSWLGLLRRRLVSLLSSGLCLRGRLGEGRRPEVLRGQLDNAWRNATSRQLATSSWE